MCFANYRWLRFIRMIAARYFNAGVIFSLQTRAIARALRDFMDSEYADLTSAPFLFQLRRYVQRSLPAGTRHTHSHTSHTAHCMYVSRGRGLHVRCVPRTHTGMHVQTHMRNKTHVDKHGPHAYIA